MEIDELLKEIDEIMAETNEMIDIMKGREMLLMICRYYKMKKEELNKYYLLYGIQKLYLEN